VPGGTSTSTAERYTARRARLSHRATWEELAVRAAFTTTSPRGNTRR
jgi:hypothetical protein